MHCRKPHQFAVLVVVAVSSLWAVPAHAQPAPPPVPLWEQWFDALNAGDVPGVVALMRTEVDEDGVLVPRCAVGCLGMDVIEASIAAMVADGYHGTILPATVQVLGGTITVTFDVAETAGTPAVYAISHWALALDGDLIVPACEGICLRSPSTRAALIGAPLLQTALLPTVPPAAAAAIARQPLPVVVAAPPEMAVATGIAGPTPGGWLLVGIAAGLLAMATSALLDVWHRAHDRPPAA